MYKTSKIKSFSLLDLMRTWVFLTTVLFVQPALAQAFFNAVEDLPLAPGLVQEPDQDVFFDSPRGRIVTVVAYGEGSLAVYRDFYNKALPALGWERQTEGSYRRDNEALNIGLKVYDHRTEVRIRVVPIKSKKGL